MVYEKQVNGSIIALKKEGEYYLCDSNFDKIYPIFFQDLKHKFSKFYIGKRNDKWALLDCLGNIYTRYIYNKIIWFEGDLFLCLEKEWTLVNKWNVNVLNETFKHLVSLKNGVAVFQNQNELIFVNGYEEIVRRVKFKNDDISFNGADMALVQTETGEIGWLKKNGQWHLTPTILQKV
jgi:hypothetical protein